MKLEVIKEFVGAFGAVEAFVTFVCMLGCAITPGFSVSPLDTFMAMLIVVSGILMFFTNFGE